MPTERALLDVVAPELETVGSLDGIAADAGHVVHFELKIEGGEPDNVRAAPWTKIEAIETDGDGTVSLSVAMLVGPYSVVRPIFFAPEPIVGPRVARNDRTVRRSATVHRRVPKALLDVARGAPEVVAFSEGDHVGVAVLGKNTGICPARADVEGSVILQEEPEHVALLAFVRFTSSDHCARRRDGTSAAEHALVLEYEDRQRRPLDARVFVRERCAGVCIGTSEGFRELTLRSGDHLRP